MLRSVEVIIITPEQTELTVNVLTSVTHKDTGERVYTGTVDAMNDPEYRAQILQTAIAELNRLRSKYNALSELAQVWDAIGAAISEHTPRGRIAATRRSKRGK